jgi:putative PIN family toxin of toxin-antitoxin system
LIRWVLDTNVVASAMLWGGTPLNLLRAAQEQRVTLFTTTALLAELTDILSRPKFERKITASTLTVDQLVDRYAALTTLVRPILISGVAPDPDDDVVIGTALAAQAQWIVTGDKPLLSIDEYQGVRLVQVSEAVQSLGGL